MEITETQNVSMKSYVCYLPTSEKERQESVHLVNHLVNWHNYILSLGLDEEWKKCEKRFKKVDNTMYLKRIEIFPHCKRNQYQKLGTQRRNNANK